MITEVKLLIAKANWPILVTEFPITTVFKVEQLLKALSAILVTEKLVPSLVTVAGIIISPVALEFEPTSTELLEVTL